MLYKTIPIMERTDGSLQIDTNKVTLTQGDYNFNINYFTKEDYSDVSPVVNVQVSFRRKDGQQTGWLPLKHIRGNQYTINLKSSWFTTVPGNMYVTFRVFQTNSNNVNLIINTSSGTLVISPTSAFNTPEPDIIPSEFEIYMSQTNEQLEDLRNDLALSQLGKGIFDNEQELLETYPNGVDYPDGTWAVLLSTNTVWLYNNETKTWYNSNRDVTDIFDLDDKVYRFAKQLYEESVNLFTNEVSDPQKWDVWFGYTSQLKPNTTYAMKVFNRQNIGNGILALYDNDTEIVDLVPNYQFGDSGVFTTPSNVTYGKKYRFRLKGTNGDDNRVFSNVILVEGSIIPNQFYQYNANRHITNEQADFLKNNFEEYKNEFDVFSFVENSKYLGGNVDLVSENSIDISAQSYIEDKTKLPLNLKENTQYTLSFDYTWISNNNDYSSCGLAIYYSDGTESGFGVNATALSGSKQWTTDANKTIVAISCDGWSYSGELRLSNIQLEEGTNKTSYAKYNQNRHITNRQACFLKNQYNKQLNLFNINVLPSSFGEQGSAIVNYETGTITITNQYTNYVDVTLKQLAPSLEAGKEYTLSANTTANNRFIYLFGTNGVWSYGETRVVTESDLNSQIGFYGNTASVGGIVTIKEIQIEEGDKVTPYKTYQGGRFVQIEDIKLSKLWQNPTPGSGFDPKLIYLPKNFKIGQKYRLAYSFGVNWPIQYYDFEFVDGDNTNIIDFFRAISTDNHFNMATRQFVCYNNVLDFGNCIYRDGSLTGDILNSVMIPRALYVIKEV